MSIRHILSRPPRRRQVGRGTAVALAALGALAASAACAPRQAIVESEPGRAAPAPASQETLATLRSDLGSLAAAQEAYEADHGHYAARTADLGFTASSGVRVSIIQGDRNGWSATATSGDAECAVYVGDVRSPRGYLTRPGEIACR